MFRSLGSILLSIRHSCCAFLEPMSKRDLEHPLSTFFSPPPPNLQWTSSGSVSPLARPSKSLLICFLFPWAPLGRQSRPCGSVFYLELVLAELRLFWLSFFFVHPYFPSCPLTPVYCSRSRIRGGSPLKLPLGFAHSCRFVFYALSPSPTVCSAVPLAGTTLRNGCFEYPVMRAGTLVR